MKTIKDYWDEDEKALDKILGFNLQSMRKKRKLTQSEIITAADIRTSQQILSKYENGGLRIPATTLFKLARALDVDVNELFGIEQENLQNIRTQKMIVAGLVEEFTAKIRSAEELRFKKV